MESPAKASNTKAYSPSTNRLTQKRRSLTLQQKPGQADPHAAAEKHYTNRQLTLNTEEHENCRRESMVNPGKIFHEGNLPKTKLLPTVRYTARNCTTYWRL